MLRAALTAVLVNSAAAGLANECMKGLRQLEGDSAIELAVRCRAAFAPEVCKQARESLGAQPWTSARMEASCAHFESAFEGMDDRALEAAVAKKAASTPPQPPAKVDASLQNKVIATSTTVRKPPAPEKKPQPKGPVANLLGKLKEAKETKEAADKKQGKQGEQGEQGSAPFAKLFAGLKQKKEEAEASGKAEGDDQADGPLANMFKKMKEAKEAREAAEKDGQDTSDTPGPLAGLIAKTKTGKENGPVKLYGETQLEEPADSNKMPQMLGALAGAAAMAAVTLLVASRRARSTSGVHKELNVQLDDEQNVE